MNHLLYDTIVAFVAFASIRYTLPNYILGKEMTLFTGFVLSLCYALCAFVRAYAKRYNTSF